MGLGGDYQGQGVGFLDYLRIYFLMSLDNFLRAVGWYSRRFGFTQKQNPSTSKRPAAFEATTTTIQRA